MRARMSRLRLTHATESWIYCFCTTKHEQSTELQRIFSALLPYQPTAHNLEVCPFLCNCADARIAIVKSIGYLHLYSKIMTDGNATHHNQEPQRSFAVLERVRVDFLTCMFEELEALNRVRRHVLEQTLGVDALSIPAEETRLRQTLSLFEKYDVSRQQGAKRSALVFDSSKKETTTAAAAATRRKRPKQESKKSSKCQSFKEFIKYLSGIPKPLVPYSIQVSKSETMLRDWISEMDMNGATLKHQMKYLEQIAPKMLVDEKTAEQSTARALTKAHMVLHDSSMSNQTTPVPGTPTAHFYSKPIILGDAIFSTDPIIDVFMHPPIILEHAKQREVLHPFMFDFIKDCQTHKEVASLAFSDEELTFIEDPRDRWWCVFTGMPIETTQEGVYVTFYFPKHPPVTLVVSYAFYESQPMHIQTFLELGGQPVACNAFEMVYAKYTKPAQEFVQRCKQRGGIFSTVAVAPRAAYHTHQTQSLSGTSTPDTTVFQSDSAPHTEMSIGNLLAQKLSMAKGGGAGAAHSPPPPPPSSQPAPIAARATLVPMYSDDSRERPAAVAQKQQHAAPPVKTVTSALMQNLYNGMATAAKAAAVSKKRKRSDNDDAMAGTGNKRSNTVTTAAAIKSAEFAQHFYTLLGKTFVEFGQALLGNYSGGSLSSLTARVLHSTVAVNSEEPEDGKSIESDSSEDEGGMELIQAIEKEEAQCTLKEGFSEYDKESLFDQITKVPALKTKVAVYAWTDPERVPKTYAVVPSAGLSHVPALILHAVKQTPIDDATISKFIATCNEISESKASLETFIHDWAFDDDAFKREFFYGMCQMRTLIMQVFYKVSYLEKLRVKNAIDLTVSGSDYENWPAGMWFVEASYVTILNTMLSNENMPIHDALCRSNASASMPKLSSSDEQVQAWIKKIYPKLRQMTRKLLSFFFRYDGPDALSADSVADDAPQDSDEDDEYEGADAEEQSAEGAEEDDEVASGSDDEDDNNASE